MIEQHRSIGCRAFAAPLRPHPLTEWTIAMRRNTRHLLLAFTTGGLMLAVPLHAQPSPEPAATRAPVRTLTLHKISEQIYWAEGGIGNAGFVIGPSGVIVVDSTISPDTGAQLVKAIASVTDKPIVAVAITHGDGDHTGGLGAFAPGTAIYAQTNAARRMQQAVQAGRSRLPASALPNHQVETREALTLGGLKVELLHWQPAHTDGDLVAYFPDLKLAFAGDIFAMDQPRPLIHRETNGTSAGWVASAKGIVALNADRFIPGHGEVQGKPALQTRISQAEAEIAQVTRLVKQGATLASIEQQTGDLPQPPEHKGPRFTPFAQVLFEEQTGHD